MSEIQRSIEEFCSFLLTEKSASVNTVAAYRSDLGQLADFMGTRIITDGWEGLDCPTIQDFILDLKARGYTETSVARKVAAARSFFGFLVSKNLVSKDPTEGVVSPRGGRALPKTITAGEINELLKQPSRRSTPEARRDRAMLELLYATGMRVTELVSLDVGDLNLKPRIPHVRCTGRGVKDRLIPIHDQALRVLLDYLQEGRSYLVRKRNERALFVNHGGKRLTRQGFWLILKEYARAANLGGDITPRTFRHSFATHMISGGMQLRNVQEMLGHANISTTQQMYHMQVTKQAHEQAHPRA